MSYLLDIESFDLNNGIYNSDKLYCQCKKCKPLIYGYIPVEQSLLVKVECLRIKLEMYEGKQVYVEIHSGYRCIEHDKEINPKGKNRTHAKRKAVDVKFFILEGKNKKYISPVIIGEIAIKMGIFCGIGIYQSTERHNHFDIFPRYGKNKMLIWKKYNGDIQYDIKEIS